MQEQTQKSIFYALGGVVLIILLWAASRSTQPPAAVPTDVQATQPVAQLQLNETEPLAEGAAVDKTPSAAALPPAPAPGGLLLQDDPARASVLIPVTGGPLKLECRANTLELPGGDRVVVRNLCGDYWSAVVQEKKETLPQAASLYTFVDGITLQLLQGSDPASLVPLAELPPGALISYHFLILPQVADHHLVGLQLSGDTWQDVSSARVGVFMEIPANRPGTFVMAAP